MNDSPYISAREAAAVLGVSIATIYAYASRGMLVSQTEPGNPKRTRYLKNEVERLKEKKEIRRDPDRAAGKNLHWGGPVLQSAITLFEGGRCYYRGQDSSHLARSWSVEEVAALLWTGDAGSAKSLFSHQPRSPMAQLIRLLRQTRGVGPLERCQIALPWAAGTDSAAYDLRAEAVARTGARILRLLAAAITLSGSAGPIDAVLQQAWVPRRPGTGKFLRAALILCADHELNVSTFTARSVASAAATPYDVVSAGLAAVKGARHGGVSFKIETLLKEAGSASRTKETVAGRLRRGEGIPGFGHPLYPEGDPRARYLLKAAAASGGGSVIALSNALVRNVAALTGQHPNVDFGLVILARTLRLPEGSALALFALGRSIGWIAHAIEQYESGDLIRPRARYTGPPPYTLAGAHN